MKNKIESCICITRYNQNTRPSQLESLNVILYLVYDDGDPPGWDSTRYYTCAACGRYWKEEFVEAMQYNANHMYPMDVDEIKKLLQNPKVNSNINK